MYHRKTAMQHVSPMCKQPIAWLYLISFIVINTIVVTSKPIITEVIPWFGGAEGGTKLTILGTGFAPDGLFSNRAVFIGAEVCEIINYFSSNDRLVCKTPKCFAADCRSDQQWQGFEESTLSVYVSDVKGIQGDQAEFRYNGGYTPDVSKMAHYTWGSAISSVTGKMTTDLLDDITIRLGGNLMDLGDEDDELNDPTISIWSSYQQIRYRTPTDMAAGFYNLSLDVQTDFSRGYRGSGLARTFPKQKPFYYSYDLSYRYNYAATLSGRVFSVGVLPAITAVSPSAGSVAGGTRLTISGNGFSTDVEDMLVYVGGRLCDVVEVLYTRDELTCVTRAADSREALSSSLLQPAAATGADTAAFADESLVLDGTRSVGSAGWWMKMWPYSVYNSDSSTRAEYPDSDVALSGGVRHGLADGFYYSFGSNWPKAASFGDGSSTRYVADFSTVLRAPMDGTYYFQGLADDRMNLFGRTNDAASAENGEDLLFTTTYRFPTNYYTASQLPILSEGVALSRGELYHLRARVVNTGGADWFEVGMRIEPNISSLSAAAENAADCVSCASAELPVLPEYWPETLLHHHTLKEVQLIDLDIHRQYEMHTYTITGVDDGYFQFAVLSEPTTPIYLDTTGSDIASALRSASLQLSSSLREAVNYAVATRLDGTTLQVNVTFIRDDPAPVTPLFILLGTLEGPFPDFKSFPDIVQYHSPLPTGTFDLDLVVDGVQLHADVPFDIAASNMIRMLEALHPELTVEVTREGGLYTGYSWIVTFLTPRGDVPQMKANASAILNVPASVAVRTLEDGDEDTLFFNTIPTWMTEVPLQWATADEVNSNVEVYVTTGSGDVMKAVCDGSGATSDLFTGMMKGNEQHCEYNYAVNATAITTNFTLEAIDAATTRVYISGSRYQSIGNPSDPPEVVVTIAGQDCNVTSLSDSAIECLVDSVPWGEHAPKVTLIGLGDALLATNATLRFKQSIYSITPDRGSFAGGQVVTIAGRGFRLDANVSFGDPEVDGAACEVIAISTVKIVCRTPAAPAITYGRRLTASEGSVVPTPEPTAEPTAIPTINFDITAVPTTSSPTTSRPTTEKPTTEFPSLHPTIAVPTTSTPTTELPSTQVPTSLPTTFMPTTSTPTTAVPSTQVPTSLPTTATPTTSSPSTQSPTSTNPTTAAPSQYPTTAMPTTAVPTQLPTTATPTSDPTTEPTVAPTTSTPSVQPTTSSPTVTPTLAPTSVDSFAIFVDGRKSTSDDGNIVYSYLSDLTPKVSAISPTDVSSAITTNITVFGELLGSAYTTIVVDAQTCGHVQIIDDFEITCLLNRNVDFGALRTVDVKIHVPGMGYAGNESVLNILPKIERGFEVSQVAPTSGSLVGGNVLTLSGFGFSFEAATKHSILLQIVGITPLTTYDELLGFLGFDLFTVREDFEEIACVPISSTFYQIDCEIPSHHGVLYSNYTYNSIITLNSVGAVCTSTDGCQYTQEMASTPTINSTVTLLGVTSQGEYTLRVFGSLLDQGTVTAWINELECAVSAISHESLVLTTPPMTAGLWDIVVNVAGFGHAWSSAQLLVDAGILRVSFDSSSGSLAGGTSTVIEGAGFSPLCSDNVITFHVEYDGEIQELLAREFLSCTATTIHLLTPTALPLIPSNAHRLRDQLDLQLPLLSISSEQQDVSSSKANISLSGAEFSYSITGTPLAVMNDTSGFAGTPIRIVVFSSQENMNDTATISIGGRDCLSLKNIDLIDESDEAYFYLARECSAPQLPAKTGAYPVLVNVPPLGYAVTNTSLALRMPTFNSELRFDSVVSGGAADLPSSFLGGKVLTVSGRGLSNDTSVSICGTVCDPLSYVYDSIECTIPNRTTTDAIDDLIESGFDIDLIASITGEYFGSSSSASSLEYVRDDDYESYYSHYSLSCFVGIELPAGYRARPYRLRFYPRLRYSTYISNYAFEGSRDGGITFETIAVGSEAHEGWNFINAANLTDQWFTAFRYLALDTTSYSQCFLAEVEVLGIVGAEEDKCSIMVTQPLAEAIAEVGVLHYRTAASFTPKLFSISPDNGTALGGTHVRITGDHFAPYNSSLSVTVEFSGVPCEVTAATDDYIDCITGRRRPEEVQISSIQVHVPGRGYAVVGDDVEYLYIDKWSALTSWVNQEPPVDGDVVWIPDGQVILLDGATPKLVFLLVEGDLYGDRTVDISIDASYVFVLGGYLEIGTEEEPFEKSAVITMHGDRYKTIEMPIFGAKVVAVAARGAPILEFNSGEHLPGRDNGQLEIHGQKRLRTWTKINETAVAGNSWLITSEPVDFRFGEEVVITNTGTGLGGGIEVMTVDFTSTDGHNVSFTSALRLTHRSQVVIVEGRSIDMRLEIGLLSRNVRIQGDKKKSDGQLFGVHTVAAGSGIFRIENAEITRCGQAFVFGRYCTHTHMAGNMQGSYVKANSIHHSYQRAVTTHDSHNWEVRDNVAYNVMGHAYFMEDGTELYNYVTGNLGIAIKPSSALLKSDKEPAIFWTATPSNFWRDNVAAHSAARGFWFELAGSVDNGLFCPASQELGEFVNMTFHSNAGIGLRIYPDWTPRRDCNGEPAPQYLYNQLSWGNGGNGIFSRRQGSVHHFGATLVNNGGHDVSIKKLEEVNYDGIPFLHDVLFVGRLDDDFDESTDVGKFAIFGPQNEFFYGRNCTFVNYGSGPGAISGCNSCLSGPNMKQGGYTTRYEGLKWVKTVKRLYWSTTQKEILWDLDGTLAGVPDSMVTRSYRSIRWPDDCIVLEPFGMFDESVRCGGNGSKARIRRMQLDGMDPRQLDFTDVIVRSEVGENEYYFLPLDSYGWVFPLVTGSNRSYTYEWRDAGISAYTMRYTLSHPAYLRETIGDPRYDEYVRMDYQPHYWDYIAFTFGLTYDDRPRWVLRNNTAPLLEMADAEYKNRTIRVAMTNKGSAEGSGSSQFSVELAARLCPLPDGCVPPPPPTIGEPMLWSRAASWYYRDFQLPQENDNVVIESDMWIVMDISPPKLGTLTIEGKLSFLSNDTDPRSLTLRCKNIAQYGIFEITGQDNGTFVGDATVVLYGRRGGSLPLTMTEGVFLGAKVLAVAGPLVAKGRSTGESWLRLNHTVQEGSSSITLSTLVPWNVGDEVVLSPTAYFNSDGEKWTDTDKGSSADEVGVIAAIWNVTDPISGALRSRIELQYPVNHTHLCEELQGELFCGAIGLLTRSVRFLSEGSEDPSSSSFGYGGHLHVFSVAGAGHHGSVHLENVELKNFGKINDDKYAIKFQYSDHDHPRSMVTNCSLNAGYNYAMRAENSFNLSFTHNVAIGNVGGSVYLDYDNALFEVSYNLLVGVRQLPSVLKSSYPWLRPIAGVTIQTNNGLCIGNLAAGSEGQGFSIATAMFLLPREHIGLCEVTWSTAYSYNSDVLLSNAFFLDNEAVGCRHGLSVVVASKTESEPDDCAVITGFKGWRSGHTGIMAVDAVANILVAHTLVAENHIGVYLDFYKQSKKMFAGIVASKIIGSLSDVYSEDGECTDLPDSKYTAGRQCDVFTESDPLGLSSTCESVISNIYQRVGLLIPQWTNKPRTCIGAERFAVCEPPNTPDRLCMLPWDNRYGLPIDRMYTEQHIHDTAFIGFHSQYAVAEDQQLLMNVTYQEPLCTLPTGELPSAAIALNPKQVDAQPVLITSGLRWQQTEVSARFTFDVGGESCGGQPCMGHSLLLINDLDGSANDEGLPAQMAFPNPNYVAAYPYCYEAANLELGLFICPFVNNITQTSDFRQYTGIWRDNGPQNIHPIVTEREFYADNRSFAAYRPIKDSCAKRMPFSQFPLLIASGHVHYVTPTGTIPGTFSIRWDAPSAADSAVLQFFVSHTQSITVWVSDNPDYGWQQVQKMDSGYPSLDDVAGTNVRDPYNRFLAVTIRGGRYRYYEFRKTPAVAVTVKMEMSLANFFSDTFIANMALLLRISTDRIKIARVRAGSVIVDSGIEPATTAADGSADVEQQFEELQQLEANITEAVSSGQMEQALNVSLEQVFAVSDVMEVRLDELNDDLDNDTVDFDTAVAEYEERIVSANIGVFRILLDYPTSMPSAQPTSLPSAIPSAQPSIQPSSSPTSIPSTPPSVSPSTQPSVSPSTQPSTAPSGVPTTQPSSQPTQPTSQPTSLPSSLPSAVPSMQPFAFPTGQPSVEPSSLPSAQPSEYPSSMPTVQPSAVPSNMPSAVPTTQPTYAPSSGPSSVPSVQPYSSPTLQPSSAPSYSPSSQPTASPTTSPSAAPSTQPSTTPSSVPTSPPSVQPSSLPSIAPSAVPSTQPSSKPSVQPSGRPSACPSSIPSSQPQSNPSTQPSSMPSAAPSTLPTSEPSSLPSSVPSNEPTQQPSAAPSCAPSTVPSAQPSTTPSTHPTSEPSTSPSAAPSAQPSGSPSSEPTVLPSSQPSSAPSCSPSTVPTQQPSSIPSSAPSTSPSLQPTSRPSAVPTDYTPAPTAVFRARVTASFSTEINGTAASDFLADSSAQSSLCAAIDASAGMNDGQEMQCSIDGAEETSSSSGGRTRRLQGAAASMVVSYKALITFLLNAESGVTPDKDLIAADTYAALMSALQAAVSSGNLTSLLQSSGVAIFADATVASLEGAGYAVSLTEQKPSDDDDDVSSGRSSSSSSDNTTILSTAAIVGIVVGGCCFFCFLAAIFYYIRRQKSVATAPASGAKKKRGSPVKVAPINTDSNDFFDLEKVPRSPDIIGSDATGTQQALWRNDSTKAAAEEEPPTAAPAKIAAREADIANDLAAYMRNLQHEQEQHPHSHDSSNLAGMDGLYPSSSSAGAAGKGGSGADMVVGMENPATALQRERQRGVVRMDDAYSGAEAGAGGRGRSGRIDEEVNPLPRRK